MARRPPAPPSWQMPFWISILIIGTFPLCFPSTQKTRVDVVPGTFPLRMAPRCALSLATSASTRQVLVGAFKMIFLFSCICILSIRWHVLAPAIEDDTLYSGYGEDQGKEDLSNVQLQKWLRGVSSLKTLLHFLLKLRFHFFWGKFNNCLGFILDVQVTLYPYSRQCWNPWETQLRFHGEQKQF